MVEACGPSQFTLRRGSIYSLGLQGISINGGAWTYAAVEQDSEVESVIVAIRELVADAFAGLAHSHEEYGGEPVAFYGGDCIDVLVLALPCCVRPACAEPFHRFDYDIHGSKITFLCRTSPGAQLPQKLSHFH